MDIMDNREPFSGKGMIFYADFRQVTPILPKATVQQSIGACLIKLYLSPEMVKVTLTKKYKGNERSIL